MSPAGVVQAFTDQARRRLVWAIVGCAILFVTPIVLQPSQFWLGIVTVAYIFAACASSWNVIGGLGGQFSLGHGVFFGVSAYAAAIGLERHDVSPWIMLPAGMVIAALIALPISVLTLRLSGPFFTIATLALNEVVLGLSLYFKSITNGAVGMPISSGGGVAAMSFSDPVHFGLLAAGYLVLVLALIGVLRRSPLGYRLRAVREDEEAAQALGTNVTSTKVLGMVISAALTAGGGTLFVMYIRIIDPTTVFSIIDVGVRFALDSMIGGLGTFWGPVLGSLLVTAGQAWVRAEFGAVIPGLHVAITGLVLVAAPLFFRHGLVGAAPSISRIVRRLRGRTVAPTEAARSRQEAP